MPPVKPVLSEMRSSRVRPPRHRPVVLVVGSINLDLVVTVGSLPTPGVTVIDGTFEQHGGGKGANQAVAAARAGAAVRFLGAVGRDVIGNRLLRDLQREHVDVTAVARFSGLPSGVALVVVDEAGENQIAVASGANSLVSGEQVRRDLASRPTPPGSVFLVGFEISDEAVVATAKCAAASGSQVIVNPAPARAISPELLELRPILTPNLAEAEMLTDTRDPVRAARILARRTKAPCIVTLGGEGAVLAERGNVLHLPAVPVHAIDETGAGDVFNGTLAAGLSDGLGLSASIERAIAAAALSVTQAGARAAPNRRQIDAILSRNRQ